VRIVQMSNIHVGPTFVPGLMDAAIEEINAFGPHLVAIPGDLTTKGYREEFEEAKVYLDRLECENVVVVPGNHDSHNVGYYHFEDLFGKRESSLTLSVPEEEAKVVALDTSEPDLDEGQVGREPPTTGLTWMGTRSRLPCATRVKAKSRSPVAPGGRWRTSFSTRRTCDTFATTGCLSEVSSRGPLKANFREHPLSILPRNPEWRSRIDAWLVRLGLVAGHALS
jgi:3',5'-cyclic AMP phosphodiesterase CpdA